MNIFNNLFYFFFVSTDNSGLMWYLVQLVIVVAATAVIFHKLGEKWWYALIPVYSVYILLKLARMKPYWMVFVIINFLVYFLPSTYRVLWMVSFIFQMGEFALHLFAFVIICERLNRGLVLPLVMLVFPYVGIPLLAYFGKPVARRIHPDHEKWVSFFKKLRFKNGEAS